MKKKFLLIPLALLFLTACPELDEGATNGGDLPKDPEEFEFSWYNGGGMINISFSALINKDSARWTYDRFGEETTLRWIPSEEDIDKFYADLRNEDFDKIKSNCEGEVFDRGGDVISIEVDGETYEIDNSGNCFIDEKSSKNYQAIMGIMHNYLDQEISKQMLEVTVFADESLINSGYLVSIDLEEGKSGFRANKDTTEMPLLMYPGYNQFTVKLDYPDSTNYYGSPANFTYEQMFEEIDENTKSILIEWVDEKIQLVVNN